MPAPYTLTPQVPTPALMDRTNRRRLRRRQAPYPEADALIARTAPGAGLGRRRIAKAELLLWVHHPDERVPLALLEADYRWPVSPWCQCLPWFRRALYQRARADADTRGLLWTPLLDRLSGSRHWPQPEDWEATRTTVGPTDWGYPHVRLDEFRLPLMGWMLGQPARYLAPLALQSKDLVVQRGAVSCLPRLTPPFLAAIPRAQHLASAAAANGALAPGAARRLADWAVGQILTGVNDYAPNSRWRRLTGVAAEGADTLLAIAARGAGPHREVRDRLLAALEPEARGWYPVVEGRTPRPRSSENRDIMETAAFRALLDPRMPLDARQAARLARLVGSMPTRLLRLVHHPGIPLALLREIARTARSPEVRLGLLRVDAARNDPTVRAILLKSRRSDIMAGLASDAVGSELADLVRRLAGSDPKEAVRVIESLEPGRRLALAGTDLTPLLLSSDEAVRMAGVFLLGDVG